MTEEKQKYPRTYHLDFSPGLHSDDKVIDSLANFIGKEVVVSEKMDGENTTLGTDYFHARSLDSPYNFTRSWIKQLHTILANDIPPNWRFCGENVAYYHSIEYDKLDSFFYLFSIWDDKNKCLSWDDMTEWANILDLALPTVFYRGVFDEKKLKEIAKELDTTKIEGFTVRLADSFHYDDFSKSLTKWVREGHVQPSADGQEEHWLKRTYPNKVADPTMVKPYYMSQAKPFKKKP
jgi:RNA ligase